MDNTKGWIIVAGFLIIVMLMALGIVWVVRDTVQRSVSPVQSMTGDLSTQVANFLHPTPTILPDPVTVIRDIRGLSRLETIQYAIEKVITAETGPGVFPALFGDRLIFVAHGIVIAGIDLGKLGPEDLVLDNGVLYVTMPESEVFVATLDNDKSYVYDRDTGLFTKGETNLETNARQEAEKEIEKAALEDGILDLARQNAEYYLERLLNDLGYPDVEFIYPSPTPVPTP
jgi:hypothetical protein